MKKRRGYRLDDHDDMRSRASVKFVDDESSGAPCRERESKRGGRKKKEPQMAEM